MWYRRRHGANFVVFAAALLFVLYLNLSGASKDAVRKELNFAWTTVRYRTTSSILPAPRGVCPGLQDSNKPALVVSRTSADGDLSWLLELTGKYHLCVYSADEETSNKPLAILPIPANRGHEAMGYLTFIIDNYDALPAAGAVFVHGSRYAWHNDAPDYDNAALLSALSMPSALEQTGYHNLRCDWSASTCDPAFAPPQGSFETAFNAFFTPWDARARSDAAFASALSSLFGGAGSAKFLSQVVTNDKHGGSGSGSAGRLRPGRSNAVRSQCCAQFAVARANIWQHSRQEYVAVRQWLLDTSNGSPRSSSEAAPADDRIAGRILSYMWHILFLPVPGRDVDLHMLNQLACPRADECYCRLYGRCDLDRCLHPGHCYGQYVVPPDFTLPKDWPRTHRS